MAGGKLQILIRGNQDTPLIGNPQITFFKQIYRKHTNFSIDSLRQTISGEPKFNAKYRIIFEHYGELLSNIYCHVNLPELNNSITNSEKKTEKTEETYLSWVNGIGYAIFEDLQFHIGDQLIDKQNGEWLFLNDQLEGKINNNNSELYYNQVVNTGTSKNNNYQMNSESFIKTGNVDTITGIVMPSNNTHSPTVKPNYECQNLTNNQISFITNFKFWFCKYRGCSLPLIAIPNLEVSLTVHNRPFNQLINCSNISSPSTSLLKNEYYNDETQTIDTYSYFDHFIFYGEYIFLDNDEKRRFAQNNHKYLIEQIQQQTNINILIDQCKGGYVNSDDQSQKYNKGCYEYNQFKLRLDFLNPIKFFVWVPHMNYNSYFNIKNSHYQEKIDNSVMSKTNNDSIFNSDKNCDCPVQTSCYNNNLFNYSMFRKDSINTSNELYLFDKAQLFMNNVPRTPNLPAKFYANIFQKRYFNNVSNANYIYVYSFSLNPNDHQPSGSCNFSKVSNVFLNLNDLNLFKEFDYSNSVINLYACSYNILTIQSGNCYAEFPF